MTLQDRITNRNKQSAKEEPISLPLLMRLAESHGDPERTITALRLINRYLMRELKKK